MVQDKTQGAAEDGLTVEDGSIEVDDGQGGYLVVQDPKKSKGQLAALIKTEGEVLIRKKTERRDRIVKPQVSAI